MFPYYVAFEVDGRLVPSGPYSEQELRLVSGEADARIDLVYDGDYELFIDGNIRKAIVLVDKDSGRMSLLPNDGSLEVEMLAAQAEGKLVFEVNGGHGTQVVPSLPDPGDTVYITLGWWDNHTGKPRAAVWEKCAFASWDACRLAAVLFMSGASYGLRLVRTFRSDPLGQMRQAVLARQKENKRRNGFIDDGWSQYPKHCMDCGAAIQIVRPGDARCPNGCWQR
jgi:hypothetical protein